MNKRSRLAALVGAGLLTFAMVGATSAAAPTFGISVTKTADPAKVPAAGASVTFTVSVTNTSVGNGGSADLAEVVVTDVFPGCTLAGGPSGNEKLAIGETWVWTCTVAGVKPGDKNTADVVACQNNGDCGGTHDAAGSASVTVGSTASGGQPSTDTLVPASTTGGSDIAWLLIAALGVLLGSLVVLNPSRIGRRS